MTANIRVLCVDDERRVLELLSEVLESEPDITTVSRTAPDEALAAFDAQYFDCVVSDYHMPGMDGLELLEAIRERQPGVPFILFTGKGTEAVASEAVSAGVTDYIRKSTGTEQYELLANRIRNAVEARRARVNYREVFDAVDDALLVVDPETGEIVDVNAAAGELWGCDEAALTAADPSSLGDVQDGDCVERFRDAPSSGSERFDWRCRTADGEPFWASVTLQRATIEGEQRALAVVRDVTRRREREQALADLLAGTSDLVAIEEPSAVVDAVVDIATGDLDVDPAAVTVTDDGTGAVDHDGEPPILVDDDAVENLEQEVLGLLETVAGAAFARASKSERLRQRERDLAHQREELAKLDQLNEVVRQVNRAVVAASTRDEIERLVCERLVAAEPYRFAWFGIPGDEVTPRAWAGIESGYLGDVTFSTDADGALSDALSTAVDDESVGVVNYISPERVPASLYRQTSERGYRSVAVVPVTYGDVLYGVVGVYGDVAGAFDERTVAVLGELGETLGYALHNADQRRLRLDDTVVDITLSTHDERFPLVALADALSSDLELRGARLETDGRWRLFVAAGDDVAADPAVDHAEVDDVTAVTGGDLFEVTLGTSGVGAFTEEHGARLRDASVTDGEARLTLALPRGGPVRPLVDQLGERYGTDLVSKAEHPPTDPEGRGALAEVLTNRQYEVLLAAYHEGFFGWPRDSSGEEVAAELGISQPTFLEHLRTAERTLLSEWFDEP